MYSRTVVVHETSNPLKFQVLEFVCADKKIDASDEETTRYRTHDAVVHAFGVTEKGHSVCATVTGFLPFFFIELPDNETLGTFRYKVNSIGAAISCYHHANIAVEECGLVNRESFYGFQNGKTRLFGCIKFYTFASCKAVFYNLSQSGKYKTFEGKIDQLFKFIHLQKFESWVEIPACHFTKSNDARTQISVVVAREFFLPHKESRIAPIRQCTVDIETYSSRSTERELAQCDANLADDVCFQIASAFKTFGSGTGEFDVKHIIVVGPCDSWVEEGQGQTVVVRCVSERDALLAWARLMVETDPDIIYTWNGDYFDFDYMVKRAKLLKIDREFLSLISRLREKPAEMEITTFTTKAFGTTDFRRLHLFGRINVDLYPYMRKETKHRMYKLGYIADQYGIGNKNPVTVHMIFASFREQDPTKIAEVARYCIQDTLLPQLLVDKLNIIPNLVELSRATFAPIRYLLHRGQQSRIICLISRHTRQAGMLIPDIKTVKDDDDDILKREEGEEEVAVSSEEDDGEGITVDQSAPRKLENVELIDLAELKDSEDFKELDAFEKYQHAMKRRALAKSSSKSVPKKPKTSAKYQGATVLAPNAGAYYQPIVTLDFASLYPSIIRAENLCYSTFVMDETTITNIKPAHIFTKTDENGNFSHRFVTEEVRQGILPRLLADLAQLRKEAKLDLAVEESKPVPDEFMCSILDARQLSKKLIMNSCYGFLATQTLPCKEIGATVTAVGRSMINQTKNEVEKMWPGELNSPDPNRRKGAVVIYGDTDSVFVDFNLDPVKFPTMKEYFAFAEEAAEKLTAKCFKKPHKLEFEKIYQPLFMLMKKRYFGRKYTRWDKPPSVDNKGVVIQRRDVCPFIQETFSECRDLVLNDTVNGGTYAFEYLTRALDDLIENKVPIEKCSITKTYSKDYANPLTVPHAAVAMKMREAGVEVCKGDKIQYVYARIAYQNSKGKPQKRTKSETARDVAFVSGSNGRFIVDAKLYIDLLQQPLCQFMDLVVGKSTMNILFEQKRSKLARIEGGNHAVTEYYDRNRPDETKKSEPVPAKDKKPLQPHKSRQTTLSFSKIPKPHTPQAPVQFTTSIDTDLNSSITK